ncbi:MAG TPA: carboxypeptidase-like regulatory domain-containing protein [Candidatus Polarisedimenticolaceae bacterium]|nr:carboxypeptidase-like regulatory domain-containing protein [Candidatus Polarisedimenticolaceae bacterium]
MKWAALACLLLGAPLLAAEGDLRVEGKILDPAGGPIAGYRIAVHLAEGGGAFVSQPSDAAGLYHLELPPGGSYVVVAVLGPNGKRFALAEPLAIEGASGATVQLDVPAPLDAGSGAAEPLFPGGERLFLQFVESPERAEHFRFEGRVDYADFSEASVYGTSFLAAIQLDSWPQAEFGAKLGLATVDVSDGEDGSGLTDLALWAKLGVRVAHEDQPEFAFGALLTVPTGDSDEGLGQDALQSKLFATARWQLGFGSLSAHAGIATAEDGEVGGVVLDGKVAPAAGAALVIRWHANLAWVLEASFEGARFEGLDDDARALAGLNWQPFSRGTVRLAAAIGLTDAAPDFQLLAGYAFDF